MSTPLMGLLSIALLFGFLLLRQPVWLALAVCGIVGNALLSNVIVAKLVTGTTAFDIASGYGLSVIPLFILMGEISSKSRLSADLFKAARIVLSGMRGGLSVATIGASGAFGAICGSSIATAATMTRIAMPEMRRADYEEGFAAASVATGGTLGILIPPSIILVIYGSIAEVSVPKLFAASLIPGLVLLVLYSVIAVIIAARSPEKAPLDAPASLKERLKALREPWQFIVLFTATIGGIYMGVFSPNEAAAVGAFGAIVLGFATGNLTIVRLTEAVRASVITSCVLFLIVIGATIFANFVVQTRLPELLLSTAQDFGLGPFAVVTIIIALYIVMGCFLEGIGMMLITVPVFLPIITGYGYDPIWFGVLVVVVVELGLITPPVGMNLFIIQAQIPGTNIVTLYRGIIPFLIAPLILIMLLFMLPQLTLWLPSILY